MNVTEKKNNLVLLSNIYGNKIGQGPSSAVFGVARKTVCTGLFEKSKPIPSIEKQTTVNHLNTEPEITNN